jgi:hypothetical protein
MNCTSIDTAQRQAVRREIRDYVLKAQALMDSIEPDSIFSARAQQLIDEVGEQIAANSQPQPFGEVKKLR